MLLYWKLWDKYNSSFLQKFFNLLNDYELYSTFQATLKTLSGSPLYLDLLDCGYGLSFNVSLPEQEFITSINNWLSVPIKLSTDFLDAYRLEVDHFVAQLLNIDEKDFK